jgi:ABC-type transport system involved in multi-copper enzyme maturation permease subunit
MSALTRLWIAVPSVIDYELARSKTPARIAMFLLMVFIPVALLISVSNLIPSEVKDKEETNLAFCMMLYALIPQVLTMLGMLVLACPIVQTELEGQTWIYSLVRYQGRRSLLLGKYIVAVLWTTSAGIVATSLSIPFLPIDQPFQTWLTICLLCLLASLAYGALFALIGVLFQKRVMVISFVYALVAEGLLAWIPAVINQFTIAYRLRSILFRWLNLSVDKYFRNDGMVQNGMVAQDPTGWAQIGWTLLIAGILIFLAIWLVERFQYSFQSEL